MIIKKIIGSIFFNNLPSKSNEIKASVNIGCGNKLKIYSICVRASAKLAACCATDFLMSFENGFQNQYYRVRKSLPNDNNVRVMPMFCLTVMHLILAVLKSVFECHKTHSVDLAPALRARSDR